MHFSMIKIKYQISSQSVIYCEVKDSQIYTHIQTCGVINVSYTFIFLLINYWLTKHTCLYFMEWKFGLITFFYINSLTVFLLSLRTKNSFLKTFRWTHKNLVVGSEAVICFYSPLLFSHFSFGLRSYRLYVAPPTPHYCDARILIYLVLCPFSFMLPQVKKVGSSMWKEKIVIYCVQPSRKL